MTHPENQFDFACDPLAKSNRRSVMYLNVAYRENFDLLEPTPSSERLTRHYPSLKLTDSKKTKSSRSKAQASVEYSDQSHEQLLRLVATHGDKAAFSRLFAYFAPRVKSHLLKMGLSDTLAEDIAQEVMVKMWDKAASFDPKKAKVSTWLFRIARNKFIDHTRKHKYPEVDADDALRGQASNSQTDAFTIARQDSDAIAKALKKLSPEQREAIVTSYYKDMTHSQVSKELSIPLGTVKSRLRLAFKVLRKELEENHD